MIVEETFYKPPEIHRDHRQLPAETYNLARLLLNRSSSDCLFIPVRSMQYLAIMDKEEIVFVHREGGRMVEIAWERFAPQLRANLVEPVSYDAVYFSAEAPRIMNRLQAEFHKALIQMDNKGENRETGIVIDVDADKS